MRVLILGGGEVGSLVASRLIREKSEVVIVESDEERCTRLEETLDAKIVHPPELGEEFAPGYYSLVFEDPDGIRVEVNHVPGKGHLGDGGRLGPVGEGPRSER